jgi:hypothetical protein
MSILRPLLALGVLMVCSAPSMAADLSKIDRTIKKEPVYQSKTPKYCLLVFGPEAKTRVWLVVDGDLLYVDRDGDGDLTAKGKRIEFSKGQSFNAPNSPIGELRHSPPVDIIQPQGATKYTRLGVMQFLLKNDFVPKTKEQKEMAARLEKGGMSVSVYIADKVRQQAGPVFADSPAEAPVVQFDGPLTMRPIPLPSPVLTRGQAPSELRVSLASAGLGQDTFAFLDYDEVPKDVHPIAEIQFPGKGPNDKGIRIKVVFDQRC